MVSSSLPVLPLVLRDNRSQWMEQKKRINSAILID